MMDAEDRAKVFEGIAWLLLLAAVTAAVCLLNGCITIKGDLVVFKQREPVLSAPAPGGAAPTSRPASPQPSAEELLFRGG